MADEDNEMVLIQQGEKESLELGGLRFVACRREVGEFGGWTLEVWGPVAGEDTQVLRFDCFRGAPHYHMPPSAKGQLELDPNEVGDGLAWALDCTRNQLPEMVEKAGFAELAQTLDRSAFAAGSVEVERLIARVPEPSESFEVPAAVVKEA
jgi:hypothetical protein